MRVVNDRELGPRPLGGPAHGEPADVTARLKVDVSHRGCALILEVRGELDAHTLPTWRRLISDTIACAAAAAPVVVDMTRLSFIACGALADVAKQIDGYRTHGVNLVVAARASTIHRLVAAGDLAIRIPIYPSTEAALLAPELENSVPDGCGEGTS